MTELIICTTCRTADTPREQRAAGDILFEAVQAEHAYGDRPYWAAVRVRGVACTAGCSRACTAAFQALGKHSYQFGDLAPAEGVARQLLDCAVLHHRAPDGNWPATRVHPCCATASCAACPLPRSPVEKPHDEPGGMT